MLAPEAYRAKESLGFWRCSAPDAKGSVLRRQRDGREMSGKPPLERYLSRQDDL